MLPFAIEARTHAAVGRRADRRVRVASTFADDAVDVGLSDLDALFPTAREGVPEWARYPLGIVWALQRGRAAPFGVDVALASDVAVGAGLSSSAAIEGAVAVALDELWDLDLSRRSLAEAGRRAENEAVGAPTGIMDQMASMLGSADAAILLDCRTLDARVIPLGFAEAGLDVLVIDTGVRHAHATGEYADRRASCEAGARLLRVASLRDVSLSELPRAEGLLDEVTFRRVRHIVTENQRVLDTVRVLREHGPLAIGDLLRASHASMRDDFEISIPELDTAVDAAVTAGAIGARMTGGGFGGAAIALVRRGEISAVSERVSQAFAAAGFRAPQISTVTPSIGAGRD